MRENWCIFCGKPMEQWPGNTWQWRCKSCRVVSNIYADATHYHKHGSLVARVPEGCLAVFLWERL